MADEKRKNKTRKRYAKKNADQINVAKQHIEKYLSLAQEKYDTDSGLANRYVTLARKVAMKFKVRFTPAQKRLFCPNCYKFMMPGKESRVRVYKGRLSHFCKNCNHSWRMPLSPRKKD